MNDRFSCLRNNHLGRVLLSIKISSILQNLYHSSLLLSSSISKELRLYCLHVIKIYLDVTVPFEAQAAISNV
jgi:hypothetical protein